MIKPLLFAFFLLLPPILSGAGQEEISEPAVPQGEIGAAGILADPGPPPSGADREFSTDFSRTTVPFGTILSGGPPKDGIPPLDSPVFETVEEASGWLSPREPVLLITLDGISKAYPLQVLMWHEIVNDRVGEIPVAVTYCPLCNTGIAFDRRFKGEILDFGTTGRLRFSNLIMYDRQTETWWQQATGEGMVGQYAGEQLTLLPVLLVPWKEVASLGADVRVLSRSTGFDRPYGQNPYSRYDSSTVPFLYRGPQVRGEFALLSRVLVVNVDGEEGVFPFGELRENRVMERTVGGRRVVVFWASGTASALDNPRIKEGKDVGSAHGFFIDEEKDPRGFRYLDGGIRDEDTGSLWSVAGQAVEGPRKGESLEPAVGINHFWFSYNAFKKEAAGSAGGF